MSYVLTNTHKIRVFVVDDHAGMREGINAVVNAQPDMVVVGEASNGREAVERFRVLHPDVSLVDWNLPIICGEEVLATLREEFPNAKFVVITARDDDESIRRALRHGAKAYLHKDRLRHELLPAIRAVHGGQEYIPQEIAARLNRKP
jgi:two-component system, NarL family, response regulator